VALNLITDTTRALIDASTTVNAGSGDVSLTAAQTASSTATAKAANTGTGTYGVGASLALDYSNATVRAEVADAAQLTSANNVAVKATSSANMTTEVQAGAKGGTAVSPAVAISLAGNDTTARLGTGSQLTLGGALTVAAQHSGTVVTSAGADAAGSSVAVGAAVAQTVAGDNTDAETNRSINAGGAVSFTADATGGSQANATAGAKGVLPTGNTAQQLITNQLNFGQTTAGVAKPISAPSLSDILNIPNNRLTNLLGKALSGVAVAAAIGVNIDTSTSTASIGGGLTVTAGGTLGIHTTNHTDASAKGDALAVQSSTAVGAALGLNIATVTNTASIGASTVTSNGDLTVHALLPTPTADQFKARALAGAGGALTAGVAGSAAINVLSNTTTASVAGGAILSSQGGIDVHAENDMRVQNVAGGAGLSLGAGVGPAVSINKIDSTTNAFLGAGTQADAANAITVAANSSVLPVNDDPILHLLGDPLTTAAGGSGSALPGFAGSAIVNVITTMTHAYIDHSARMNTNIAGGQNQTVTVQATDDLQLKNWAGALVGSGAIGVGIGVDIEVITTETQAYFGALATVKAGGSITALASSTEGISSLAATQGLGGVAGIVGAASIYVQTTTTQAYIDHGTTVTAGGAVQVEADHGAALGNVDGVIAGGGSAGFGIANSTVVSTDTTQAYIGQTATVTAGGVAVTATNAESLSAIALGGSGAGGAGIAGSATISVLTETTQAYVDQSAQIGIASSASGSQSIDLLALDNTTIQDAAGILAGGGTAGIGAGADVGVISKTTEAYLAASATASAPNGNVTVQAQSAEQVQSLAAGVGGAGVVGIAGGAGVYNVTDTTKAYIGVSAGVSAGGNVLVAADDASQFNMVDGTGAVGGVVGISGSAAVTILNKTTVAFIGSGASVTALGNQAAMNVADGKFDIQFSPRSSIAGIPLPDTTNADFLGETALTHQRSATAHMESIKGVAVTALSQDAIEAFTATAGGGGVVGVQIVGVVDIPTITTTAYIDTGAQVNANNTSAGAGQSVLVAAGSDFYHFGIAGTASFAGVAAVAPALDLDVIKLTTTAYIGNSAQVNPTGDIRVVAGAAEYLVSGAAGFGGAGVAGVAGAVPIVYMSNTTRAYIGDSATVHARGNVGLWANDATHTGLIAGAGALGGVAGVGVAVAITLINKDTQAFIGQNASVNGEANTSNGVTAFDGGHSDSGYSTTTVQGIAVQAGSSEDLRVATGSGALALFGAFAGAVSVEVVRANTRAYILDGAQVNQGTYTPGAAQTVNVAAVDDSRIHSFDGSGAVAAGLLTGAVDVGIVQNNTAAFIGNGAHVKAKQDVVVNALANKDLQTHTANLAIGGLALGGAVWVYALGTGPDTRARGMLLEGTSNSLSGYADGKAGAPSFTRTSAALNGYQSTGSDSNQRVAAAMSNVTTAIQNAVPSGAVNNAVDSTTPAPASPPGATTVPGGTVAFIGNTAAVSAGQNITINAKETITMNMEAGQTAGGLLGFGAAVGVTDIAENTQAFVGPQATVSATSGDVGINANLMELVQAHAYAGIEEPETEDTENATTEATEEAAETEPLTPALGGIVVTAQVIVLHDTSTESAYLGDGARVLQAGNVQIQAEADRTLSADSTGGAFSTVAVGGSWANVEAGGSTHAYLGNNVRIGVDGKQVQSLSIDALDSSSATAQTHAVQTGTVAGGAYNNATADVNPSVTASMGNNANVQVNSDIAIAARDAGDATATALGDTAAAGVAVAVSQATANLTPTLTAQVGQNASLNVGGNLTVESSHNYDASGNPLPYAAQARATSGGKAIVVGGVGAEADAVNSPIVSTSLGGNSNISTTHDLSLISQANNKVRAQALGSGGGIIGIGVSIAHATAKDTNQALVGASTNLNVGHDLTISATSQEDLGTPITAPGTQNEPGAFTTAATLGVLLALTPDGANDTTADAQPNVTAQIGTNDHITVTHSTALTAAVHGNAIADAEGTSAGAVDIGSSKATTTWQPTVVASVGDGAHLSSGTPTSGGDVSVQATGGDPLVRSGGTLSGQRAEAIATSSAGLHVASWTGATATVNVTPTARALLGNNVIMSAGHDLVIDAASASAPQATANESSSLGIFTGSSTVANATVTSNEARAATGANDALSAGNNIRLRSDSSLSGSTDAESGQSFAVATDGSVTADTEVTSNTTEADLGTGNAVNAQGQFRLEAVNADTLTALSRQQVTTVAGSNAATSDTRILSSSTHTGIGDNSFVHAPQVYVAALDSGVNLIPNSAAITTAIGAATSATSAADGNFGARTDLGQNVQIIGRDQINLVAHEDNLFVSSASFADLKYAVPGIVPLSAVAERTLSAGALIATGTGSMLQTAQLMVDAPTPAANITQGPSAFYEPPGLPVLEETGDEHRTGNQPQETGVIDFNSTVTVLAAPSPILHVDANGNIVTADGVSGYIAGNQVVVNPITVTPVDSVTINTGVIAGNYSLDFNNSVDSVTLLNESAKDLVINGIHTPTSASQNFTRTGTPLTSLDTFNDTIYSSLLSALRLPVTFAQSTQTTPFNTVVDIENRGGKILEGSGTVETANLVLFASGDIGTSANPLSIRLLQGLVPGTNPTLTVDGEGSVYLSTTAVQLLGDTAPLAVSLPQIDVDDQINWNILGAVRQVNTAGVLQQLPTSASYTFGSATSSVTAGGNITVTAASTTLNVGQMTSTSGNVSLTTTGSGAILAATNGVNITTNALTLNAAGDIGQASHYLDATYSTISAQAGTGRIYIAGLTAAPAFTGASNISFLVGSSNSFTIQTSGFPKASLTKLGLLPLGVTFADNGDGTATLSGVPALGTSGSYLFTISASNFLDSVNQTFTLTVNEPATITTDASQPLTFASGANSSYTIQTAGTAPVVLTESGVLPAGITFDPSTGILSGTPTTTAQSGEYLISFTASNSFGSPQTVNFKLDVTPRFTSPSTAIFKVGKPKTFTVTTAGSPHPVLSATGLPSSLQFTDNGNGTGTISGTATSTDADDSPFDVTITATSNGVTATQDFGLIVNAPGTGP
jgi:hypothetical protein